MNMSLWDQTLKEFRDKLASSSPTPGGGSAAFVSAALGAALVSMAVEVSLKKEHDPKLDSLPDNLKEVMDSLSAAADEDEAAFGAYMDARRLPEGDATEKDAKTAAMAAALRRSAEAPVSGVRSAIEGLKFAADAAPYVSKGIISDVGCGASLLFAGIEAALLTADMSLAAMNDQPEYQGEYAAKLKELSERAAVAKDAARRAVLSRM